MIFVLLNWLGEDFGEDKNYGEKEISENAEGIGDEVLL